MTRDIANSILNKLKAVAVEEKVEHQFVLIRYGLERFLYRLGNSRYKDDFILKGAMLFPLWGHKSPRSTRRVSKK